MNEWKEGGERERIMMTMILYYTTVKIEREGDRLINFNILGPIKPHLLFCRSKLLFFSFFFFLGKF